MEIFYLNILVKIFICFCELRELDVIKGYIFFIDDVVGKFDVK